MAPLLSEMMSTPDVKSQEAWITVTCPVCKNDRTADQFRVERTDRESRYFCQCGAIAAIVSDLNHPALMQEKGAYILSDNEGINWRVENLAGIAIEIPPSKH